MFTLFGMCLGALAGMFLAEAHYRLYGRDLFHPSMTDLRDQLRQETPEATNGDL